MEGNLKLAKSPINKADIFVDFELKVYREPKLNQKALSSYKLSSLKGIESLPQTRIF